MIVNNAFNDYEVESNLLHFNFHFIYRNDYDDEDDNENGDEDDNAQ